MPSSVFLTLPETEHVAGNALAFAIRDRYPVSPGHTLCARKAFDRAFAKAMKSAGLAPEFFDRLHAIETAEMERSQKKYVLQTRAHALALAKRRKRDVRRASKFRRYFSKTIGNPAYLICLWRADAISWSNVYRSDGGYHFPAGTSIGVGANVARAQVGSIHTGIMQVRYYHDFSWNSTLTGLLTASAVYNLNGHYDLLVNGSCGAGGQDAIFNIKCRATITQRIGDGPFTLNTPWQPISADSLSAGCSGASKSGVLLDVDDLGVTNSTPFPVVAGTPVAIRITTEILATSLQINGGGKPYADIVLSLPGYGIDVPTIWLGVEA